MRIIIKILLFPIVLALTLLVAFCRFFCLFSGIAAFLLFLLGIVVLFAGRVDGFIGFLVLAWLVSPYGLPLAASWLTERVADFNHMLKSI
uniref:CD1845 family protein n=1 Tax=Candidatus Ventrimonas sp. TaxID=3048889 RepID=UPI003FEF60A4